uniref:Uncharacterized protein n=1 Tax=Plectus sambesii TaxID=2011161 RepID=A0A914V299_9BILA
MKTGSKPPRVINTDGRTTGKEGEEDDDDAMAPTHERCSTLCPPFKRDDTLQLTRALELARSPNSALNGWRKMRNAKSNGRLSRLNRVRRGKYLNINSRANKLFFPQTQ